MTKALPYTEESVRRAIEGVRKAGLDVTAVTVGPDGSVTVHQKPVAPAKQPPSQTEIDRWTPEV